MRDERAARHGDAPRRREGLRRGDHHDLQGRLDVERHVDGEQDKLVDLRQGRDRLRESGRDRKRHGALRRQLLQHLECRGRARPGQLRQAHQPLQHADPDRERRLGEPDDSRGRALLLPGRPLHVDDASLGRRDHLHARRQEGVARRFGGQGRRPRHRAQDHRSRRRLGNGRLREELPAPGAGHLPQRQPRHHRLGRRDGRDGGRQHARDLPPAARHGRRLPHQGLGEGLRVLGMADQRHAALDGRRRERLRHLGAHERLRRARQRDLAARRRREHPRGRPLRDSRRHGLCSERCGRARLGHGLGG